MEFDITSKVIKIQTANIHYFEGGDPQYPSVLFLHGSSFSSQTWKDLGTLKRLTQKSFHVVAIDLPGYGKSESISDYHVEFLPKLVDRLNLKGAVLVSPSMSGTYSLSFVVKHSEQLKGFVAVAPVGILKMSQQLRGILLPTLAIWGSDDRIVPVEQADLLVELMPNAQKVILPKAGHACYMKATNKFHEALIQFVEKVTKEESEESC
ncbi:alpha/beta hydrolase [Limnoraphis robusta Tam1]|uniref:alpha/beta fold hydrolase n=1 Tax=Limnoraphis robusta TaxID=1118279 RepID=UPI002B1EF502|nr:alpha/beta hydrolase [Limnoraphis robusta]MEA5541321.1 alpha/beta hydrolase [Limnoraphis robusta Tam1]